MSMKNGARLLIVGLDGATWRYIKSSLDKLPTFDYLIKHGTHGVLQSTIPPMTIPGWPSMFSGLQPGQLGTIDFKRKEANQFRLNSSKSWKGKVLWDLIRDKRSLIVNIPFTYPPYEINGDMVCFDFSPPTGYTYPPELENEIESKFNLHQVRNLETSIGKKQKIESIYAEEKKILEVSRYLFSKNYYDIAIVRFGIPDHISHVSQSVDDIISSMMFLDSCLKELINDVNFDYLFLVSDHSIKKAQKKFCINTWLYRKGYLSLKLKGKFIYTILKLGRPVVEKYSPFLQRLADKIRGGKAKSEFDMALNDQLLKSIDFDKTLAFAIHSNSLEYFPIYINHDENDSEYTMLREKLRKHLQKVNIVEAVWMREEIYKCNKKSLPDLIIKAKYPVLPTLMGQEVVNIDSFTHSMDGIFLAYGPDIKQGFQIEDARIYDVAPTILHMFGSHIPQNMDGRILKDIFYEDSVYYRREPKYTDSVEEEKRKVSSKIRDLIKHGFIR